MRDTCILAGECHGKQSHESPGKVVTGIQKKYPKKMHCENGGGWTSIKDNFQSRVFVQEILKFIVYYKS